MFLIAMTDLRENLGWLVGSIATTIAMAGGFISSGVVFFASKVIEVFAAKLVLMKIAVGEYTLAQKET